MAKNKKQKLNYKKHCNGKREVFRMIQNQIEEKNPQRPVNNFGQQLQIINQLRPVLEKARKRMIEQEGKQA